ncbi:putative N-acetyltransferase [Acanthamoeba polyphaga mimivirus]|uniref:N-acetyltransferase n=1 Tax=Acanthamoeba polyphaga mimivirus Kroon TaxID=3069720 RepID=A0A0G2Y6U9_9VIRU|nr:putative N-acetyltransferase [Acanthamoeba polyphaga mimivirus]AKI80314.1 putative N-acetyltransferase [Acanthamoeba polyphaga mimivirus Kroon]
MPKSSSNNQCPPGEILREGYYRHGYERRGFKRSSGTYIPPTEVSEAYVPPTCIIDRGKPGKGPRILPKPGNDLHLSWYGYAVHESERDRHRALVEASQENDPLEVLRRLNLLRNYQAYPDVKDIMSQDVKFMSDLYAKYKERNPEAYSFSRYRSNSRSKSNSRSGSNRSKSNSRSGSNRSKSNSRSKSSRSRSNSKTSRRLKKLPENDLDLDQDGGNRYGGDPLTSITSDTTGNQILETNIKLSKETECSEGKCQVFNKVYESHTINGKKIVFETLNQNDSENILSLDKLYLDSDQTIDRVKQNLSTNKGHIIGIKSDNKLEGYCWYKEVSNNEVKIFWFCANKGYGTALYTFMEKYFKLNNYSRIVIDVSMEGSYAVRRINFWNHQGFKTYQVKTDNHKIHMEKDI